MDLQLDNTITLKNRLFYFFPLLFSFCLPFGTLFLSHIIIIWCLFSFINIEIQELKKGLLNKNLQLCYLFFIITILSALMSDNKIESLFSIEIKLSFLILPYLVFCFRWPIGLLKKCFISFVSGCFFACIYLIIRALIYKYNNHSEYFFYSLFSKFLHTAYFSMYLLLAISIIIIYYTKWFNSQKNIIYTSYIFIFTFGICIILCSSKIGILSLLIISIILFYYKFKTKLSLKNIGVFILSLSLIIITINKLLPNSLDRFNSLTNISSKHQDKKSSESTTLRILIWEQSINLIKNNFLLGTGVGDANDELYKKYQSNGIDVAFDEKLNAHNQFLQTFIGIGLFGFILLCIISIGQIFIAYNKKNILMFVFFIIISLNFFVESMLQTSAGVLFFVFFFCLINKSKIYLND